MPYLQIFLHFIVNEVHMLLNVFLLELGNILYIWNIILLLPTFFPWVNVFNCESIPVRHKRENDTEVIYINVPETS